MNQMEETRENRWKKEGEEKEEAEAASLREKIDDMMKSKGTSWLGNCMPKFAMADKKQQDKVARNLGR